MSKLQRGQAMDVLNDVAQTIRKNYYDPQYHGIDFEARVTSARQRLNEANTLTDAMGVIGWMVDGLKDSHTFFMPPPKPYEVEHGWKMQFYGDHCYVTAVKSGSDAEARGLKPGDEVLGWERYHFNRRDLWKMEALFLYFAPRSGTTVLVAAPGVAPKEMQINAKVRPLQKRVEINSSNVWNLVRDEENYEKLRRPSWVEIGDTLVIKMPSFATSESALSQLLSTIHKHKSLVLDLRGNSGGYVDELKDLVSGTFDHEVKIADIMARKPEKPLTAKPRSPFTGKLIVLVDSRSASAAEIFARTVQLEKRGIVVGDRSSGSVMQARRYFNNQLEGGWDYRVSVTNADLVMSDGARLENAGVTPDEIVLPTQSDLASGRNPMLARAIKLVGSDLSPEAAGKLFPAVWTPPRLLN